MDVIPVGRFVEFLRVGLEASWAACERGERIPFHCGYSTALLDVGRRFGVTWSCNCGNFRPSLAGPAEVRTEGLGAALRKLLQGAEGGRPPSDADEEEWENHRGYEVALRAVAAEFDVA